MVKYTEKSKQTKLRYGGSPVIQTTYQTIGKDRFTRGWIYREVTKLSDGLARKGIDGKIMTTLFYPAPRSGKPTQLGEPISLFSMTVVYDEIDDYDFIKFTVYTWKNPPRRGGQDPFNDCFYNALIKLQEHEVIKVFPDPEDLKKYLGIERNDMIEIDHIPLIEDALKNIEIHVSGDDVYSSTFDRRYKCCLTLHNQHFEINKKEIPRCKGVNLYEKKIVFYTKSLNKPDKFLCYSGSKLYYAPKADVKELMIDFVHSSYIFIYKAKIDKEEYKTYIEEIEEIKSASKGIINFYKTGTIKKTALNLFLSLTPSIIPENITQAESEFIEDANIGALVYGEKDYEGELHKIDVNSMYPYIYSSNLFLIPIKEGNYKQITNAEMNEMKFFEFGFYRAIITGDSPKKFRLNPSNCYTHYDMTMARRYGLEIKMIENEKPNALIYNKDQRVPGDQMFKEYVQILYPLKKKGVKLAKRLLNIIWGVMAEKHISHKFIKNEIVDIPTTSNILDIIELKSGDIRVDYNRKRKIFKSNYARISPFLMSMGRKLMGEIIDKNESIVKRVHTDGLMTTKKLVLQYKKGSALSAITFGTGLGQMKYEGYCKNAKIINSNNIEGEFLM